jgi:Holliday junction resolvase RusA-like endonuclease
MEKVVFNSIPMPPTSNKMYSMWRRGSKTYHVPSPELKAFQGKMLSYPIAQEKIDWLQTLKGPLSIECFFFFKRERLYTKKEAIKKLDVSNRIKALHDCLCRRLGIDDSLFFEVYAVKMPNLANDKEFVDVHISPC